MSNKNNSGFKVHDLLGEINFGIKNFSFIKKDQMQKIIDILADPYLMQLFYYNEHYISYPNNDPSVILTKLEKVSHLCKGLKNKRNGINFNLNSIFELIENNKNNQNLISSFHLEKIGEWIDENLLNKIIEDILLFDKGMIYIELFSDKKFISHLIMSYTQTQVKNVELNKKNHLYSLNIFFEQLKQNVNENIEKLKNKRELSIFADESIHLRYILLGDKVNKENILNHDSIYNFIDYRDLDILYKILPKYYFYMLIKKSKIEDINDMSILTVYEIIERNIEGLKTLTPPHLKEFNLLP